MTGHRRAVLDTVGHYGDTLGQWGHRGDTVGHPAPQPSTVEPDANEDGFFKQPVSGFDGSAVDRVWFGFKFGFNYGLDYGLDYGFKFGRNLWPQTAVP